MSRAFGTPSSVSRGASDAVPVVAVVPFPPRVVMVETTATCHAVRRGEDTRRLSTVAAGCGDTAIRCPLGRSNMQDESEVMLAARGLAEKHVIRALIDPSLSKRGPHTTNPPCRKNDSVIADTALSGSAPTAPFGGTRMTDAGTQEKAKPVTK